MRWSTSPVDPSIASRLLKTDPELALYGRYCVSRRLREERFEFLFPDLPSALADLYKRHAE